MLTQIKEFVWSKVYEYHYDMANYYYRKSEKDAPEYRAKWEDRMLKHTVREMLAVEKLVKMREA